MGVLLHPTSLPGRFGVGDLGPEAYRFVDWLARAGVRVWQVLPLCPPGGPRDDVPYASWASLAGNPQLISLDALVQDGLLGVHEIEGVTFYEGWADLERALPYKEERISWAVGRLLDHRRDELREFARTEGWAVEAARFAARKGRESGRPWWQWSPAHRALDEKTLLEVDAELGRDIDEWLARFYFFERQWSALRAYARDRGVSTVGDIPIYVPADGVDVWYRPHGYRIRPDGSLLAMSGTPPDFFSETGQLWGGPLYDWDRMAQDDYAWWRMRLARAFAHVDGVRIDHFRAFSAFWEVPEGAATAAGGRWVKGPGLRFFEVIERHMGRLPLCAEDLGTIDQEARDLLHATGFPGMKILHFAFGEDARNPYLPHNVDSNAVIYPGNHDNDTTVGWWRSVPDHVRSHVQYYLGRHGDDIAWDLNRAVLASRANLAIIQMQDLLSLDSSARMNDPSSYEAPPEHWRNWRWRLRPGEASDEVAGRLRHLGELYGRVS